MSKRSKAAAPFKYLAYGEILEAPSNRPGWHFAITLRFGEETFEFRRLKFLGLTKARISIGINCADISFMLSDCVLPDEDWQFDPRIEVRRSVERRMANSQHGAKETGSELRASATVKSSVGTTLASMTGTSSQSLNTNEKEAIQSKTELEDRYKRNLSFVKASGGPNAPKWRFEASADQAILTGTMLKARRFASAKVTGLYPEIEMWLEIPDHAIMVRDGDGMFQNVNKQKIARLRIKKVLSRTPHLLCVCSLPAKSD